MKYDLLTAQDSTPKLEHSSQGASARYVSAVLYLAPHKLSGRNLCPNATPGCVAACLNLAGRGGIGGPDNAIQRARKRRALEFLADRSAFLERIAADIERLRKYAQRIGKLPAVRLNGTSDIPWENVRGSDGRTIFERFPDVRFYDYTKSTVRAWGSVYGTDPRGDGNYPGVWPSNYHLTYSRSEESVDDWIRAFLSQGGTVSVVYASDDRSRRAAESMAWNLSDRDPVNGDATDYRFLDPRGSVNLLRAKGPAAKDRTGFAIRA